MTDTKNEIIKEFREKFVVNDNIIALQDSSDIEKFLASKLQEVERDTANDILLQLDHLEMEQPEDLKTDNWRNWKYIRNSIVDEYGLLAQLKGEHHG